MKTLRLYVNDSVTRDRIEKVCHRLCGTPATSSRVWKVEHSELTQAQGYAIKDLLEEGRTVPNINWEAVQMRVSRLRDAYHANRHRTQSVIHECQQTRMQSQQYREDRLFNNLETLDRLNSAGVRRTR